MIWLEKLSATGSEPLLPVNPSLAITIQCINQAYELAQTFINQCLSENPGGWYERQGVLDGRGEETQYLLEEQVRGSLRKMNSPGLFKDSWSVYFWIDSPSMLR